eukprot:8886926-Pyramimonas_sp.AAC.1
MQVKLLVFATQNFCSKMTIRRRLTRCARATRGAHCAVMHDGALGPAAYMWNSLLPLFTVRTYDGDVAS